MWYSAALMNEALSAFFISWFGGRSLIGWSHHDMFLCVFKGSLLSLGVGCYRAERLEAMEEAANVLKAVAVFYIMGGDQDRQNLILSRFARY
jgi:hypothetical protein